MCSTNPSRILEITAFHCPPEIKTDYEQMFVCLSALSYTHNMRDITFQPLNQPLNYSKRKNLHKTINFFFFSKTPVRFILAALEVLMNKM